MSPTRRGSQQAAGLLAFTVVLAGIALAIVALSWLLAHLIVFGFLLAGACAIGVLAIRSGRREAASRAQIRYSRSLEISQYHAMDARQFEEAIAFLCQRDGCTDVRVVGGAGDLGADVIATAPDGRRIVIQCKRYGPTNKVGSQDMQRFGGTCYNVHGAHVAAVVTTSTFTRPAAQYASGMRIGLYDADELAGWASRTGPAPWM